MNDIVQLRLFKTKRYTENDIQYLNKFFSDVIKKCQTLSIWDESIKALVVTDNFREEVEKQASQWNLVAKISQEKDSIVVAKNVFNHKIDSPEYHIFFDVDCFNNVSPDIERIALTQVSNISSQNLFPRELLAAKFNFRPNSLEEYVKNASTEWCKTLYTKTLLDKVYGEGQKVANHNSFLTAFKRKLKRSLFEYNGDELEKQNRLDLFWDNYFDSIKTLYLRIMENFTSNEELLIKASDPCRDNIYHVVNEIHSLTLRLIKKEAYDVTGLKEAIKLFSGHYEVFLEDESERNFRIRLTKDPKDYFVGEIVETEPRFVCFMDILGFSELINDYDKDITSTVLQDIQESFDLAKRQFLDNNLPGTNQNAVRHLKYQTFSDNICISIPFFDNKLDFMANFNLLATYVRGFQLIMMHKGFFTRGGLSMGSYYADNNIIFSKGLVNAYLLESKKAVYPRIVIDKEIIKKLIKYSDSVKEYGLEKAVIFDWENTAFLNPLEFSETSALQMKMLYNQLYSEGNDELTNSINSMVKQLEEQTDALFEHTQVEEKKNIEPIRNKIAEKLFQYKENEAVLSKYLWLFEFIRWIQKDPDVQLKFTYMSRKLNT